MLFDINAISIYENAWFNEINCIIFILQFFYIINKYFIVWFVSYYHLD